MPELPEVETVRRGLLRLVGQPILGATTSGVPLRKPSPSPLEELEGWTVQAIRRHAKILFFDLEQDGAHRVLSAHLGMTGTFRFAEPGEPLPNHVHLQVELERDELRFRDPRRFGWLSLYPVGQTATDAEGYGPDCLSDDFTLASFESNLQRSKAPIKSFLLDQSKQAGIGNIYACEALYRARISPRRLASNIGRPRRIALHQAIRDVLQESVDLGGTSLNDYVDTLGDPGTFIEWLDVFQRAGMNCHGCDTPIKRIVQANRSTFYCPGCQR